MNDAGAVLEGAVQLSNQLPLVWTFILYVCRYTAMMFVLPGISGGRMGFYLRYPAVLALAVAATVGVPHTEPLPAHVGNMILLMASEMLVGFVIGLIPLFIVSGVQMAAHLASTSMGLGASQLVDPNLGVSIADLARISGDVVVITFLLLGGHEVVIYALAGLNGELPLGVMIATDLNAETLIRLTSSIFTYGALLSAPIMAALLLTQFAMGLVSRAVPSVNIFIMSFPVTIGVGLIMTVIILPDVVGIAMEQIQQMDADVLEIAAQSRQPVDAPVPEGGAVIPLE